MRKFLLVFKTRLETPACSVIEGEDLLGALKEECGLPLYHITLVLELDPRDKSVDDLGEKVRDLVAKCVGVKAITID